MNIASESTGRIPANRRNRPLSTGALSTGRCRALLFPALAALMLLPFAVLSASSGANEAEDSLFLRAAGGVSPVWSRFSSCAITEDDSESIAQALESDAIPTATRRDYSQCGEQALRAASGQMLLATMEDALRQGGLAAFSDGFSLDSRLSWVWGEELQGELDAVLPLWDDGESAVFLQPGFVFWTGQEKAARLDANFGLVYRRALGDNVVAGGGVFYDHDFERGHRRLGVSADLQGAFLRGGINYYHPLSEWREGRVRYEEQALQGLDARLTGHFDRLRLGGTLGYWRFDGERTERSRWRPSYGVDAGYRVYPGVFLEGGFEAHDDAALDARWNAGLAFRFTLPGLQGQDGAGEGAPTSSLWRSVEREKRILYEERVAVTPATATLSVAPTSVDEGDTSRFTITLDRALTGSAVFAVSTTGSATSADFTDGLPSSLTIPAGETSVNRALVVADDAVAEGVEYVQFSATTTIAAIEVTGTPRLTISSSDNTAQFASASSAATEGVNATTSFAVTLSSPAPAGGLPLSISFTDPDNNSISVSPSPRNFTIPAGSSRQNFIVTINEDPDTQGETIAFTLATGAGFPPDWGALGAVTTHTLTITDNDTASVGFFGDSPARIAEGATSANFTVSTTDIITADFQVTVAAYTVSNGVCSNTAATGVTINPSALDFTTTSSSDTFTVAIANDSTPEADETICLRLAEGSNFPATGWQVDAGTRTFTIPANDNTVGFTASSNAATVSESDTSHPIPIAANLPLPSATTLNVATSGNTELADLPATISITGATATLTATINDNSDTEDNDPITITISAPSLPEGWSLATTTYTLTVANDDADIIQFAAATSAAPVNEANTSTHNLALSLTATTGNPFTVAVAAIETTDSNRTVPNTGDDISFTTPFTITPGTTTQLPITIRADDTREYDRTYQITLSNPSSSDWTIGAQSTHTFTIEANDNTVGFTNASNTATVNETAGTHAIPIAANLALPSAATLYVATSGNTALATLPPTISITDTANLTATINNNPDTDDNAPITITISADNPATPATERLPNGWFIDANTYTLTVANDDTDTIAFAAATTTTPLDEANISTHNLALALSKTTGNPFTVDITAIETTSSDRNVPASGDDISFTTPFTITPASTTQLPITIRADDTAEDARTYQITLASTSNSDWIIGSQATHTFTIAPNDKSIAFTNANSSHRENAGTIQIPLTLNFAPTSGTPVPLTVSVVDDADTTAAAADYTLDTTAISATAQTGNNINLTITNDGDGEGDETIKLRIAQGSNFPTAGGWNLGAQTTHILTIEDDDQRVSFTPVTMTAAEGEAYNISIGVDAVPTATHTFRLSLSTLASTGTAADFSSSSALPFDVTFTPQDHADRTVRLTVTDDTIAEGSETITLTLTPSANPDGYSTGTHTLTIPTNDNEIAFSAATSTVAEDTASAHNIPIAITTTPANTAPTDITLSVAIMSGNIAGTDDFTAPAAFPTTVTIAAGETSANLALTLNDDVLAEGDETITFAIIEADSTIPAGWALGSQTTHELTITDDNTATVGFTASTATGSTATASTIGEGSNATITVTAASTITRDFQLSVDAFEYSGGACSATSVTSGSNIEASIDELGSDNVLNFTTADADRADTFRINIANDSDPEDQEQLCLRLATVSGQEPPGGWSIDPNDHIITIPANDKTVAFVEAGPTEAVEDTDAMARIQMVANFQPATALPFTVTITPDTTTSGAAANDINNDSAIITHMIPATAAATGGFVLNVPIDSDTITETPERFTLSITAPTETGWSTAQFATHTIDIIDDDGVIAFSSSTAAGGTATASTVAEPGSDTTITLGVTIDPIPAEPITVTAVVDEAEFNDVEVGTLSEAGLVTPITITFPANAASATQTFTATIKADDIAENAETITIDLGTVGYPELAGRQGRLLGLYSVSTTAGTHTVTIPANDKTIRFSTNPATTSVAEGAASAEIGLVTNFPPGQAFTLATPAATIAPDAATPGATLADIVGTTTTITAALDMGDPASSDGAGTLTITNIPDDAIAEADENFTITLAALPSALTTAGWSLASTGTTHTLTITDDDQSLGWSGYTNNALTVDENVTGGTVTLNLALSPALTGSDQVTVTVQVAVGDRDQLNFGRLSAENPPFHETTVTFDATSNPATATVELTIEDDTDIEGNLTYDINIVDPADATATTIDSTDSVTYNITPQTLSVTITDNDINRFRITGEGDIDEGETLTYTVRTTPNIPTPFQVTATVFGESCARPDLTVARPSHITIADATLDFSAANPMDTFTLTFADDTDAEPTEVICIMLSEVTNWEPARREITLNASDNTVSFTQLPGFPAGGDAAITEGSFTITATNPSNQPIIVTLDIDPADHTGDFTLAATSPATWDAANSQLTIPANADSASMTLTAVNDQDDNTENFTITISSATSAQSGWAHADNNAVSGTAQLPFAVDNGSFEPAEVTIGFTAGPATVAEGATATQSDPFTVSTTGTITADFSIIANVYLADCTTAAGADITSINTSPLEFSSTVSSVDFTVSIAADDTAEADETYCIKLTPGTGFPTADLTLSPDERQFTIAANDNTIALSTTSSTTLNEGAVNNNLTITLSNPASQETMVHLDGLDNAKFSNDRLASNPPAGAAYDASTGIVTIPAGATTINLVFTIENDSTPDPSTDYEFSIDATPTLATFPTGWGSVPDATDSVTFTIPANDNNVHLVTPSFTAGAATTTFDLVASNASTGAVTVNFTITPAAYTGDFTISGAGFQAGATAGTATATIPANATTATLTLTAVDDSDTNSESFTIAIASATSAQSGWASTDNNAVGVGPNFTTGATNSQFVIAVDAGGFQTPTAAPTIGFAANTPTSIAEGATVPVTIEASQTHSTGIVIQVFWAAGTNCDVGTAEIAFQGLPFQSNRFFARLFVGGNTDTVTFNVQAVEDNATEEDEPFCLGLFDAFGQAGQAGGLPAGWVLDSIHRFTVPSNDNTIQFAATGNPATATEGTDTTIDLTVELTNPPPEGATGLPLALTVTTGDADAVTIPASITLTRADVTAPASPGDPHTATISFSIAEDADMDDENITLTLAKAATGFPDAWGDIGADSTHTIAITDDDSAASLGNQAISLFFESTTAAPGSITGRSTSLATTYARPESPNIDPAQPSRDIDFVCLLAKLPEGTVAPAGGLPLVVSATREDGSNPAGNNTDTTRDIQFTQLSAATGGTTAIAANTNSRTFCAVVYDDAVAEPDETYHITIATGTNFPAGWGIVQPTVQLTIPANDQPTQTIQFAATDATAAINPATVNATRGSIDLVLTLSAPAPADGLWLRLQANSAAIYTGPQLRETGTGGEDDREAEFFIPAGAETWKVPVYWGDNRIGQSSGVALFASQQEDRALPDNWQVGTRASLAMTVTAAVDNKLIFDPDNIATLDEGKAGEIRILLQDASGYPLAAPAGGLTVLVRESALRSDDATLYAKTGSATEASVSIAAAGNEVATVSIPAGVTEATIPLTITLDSDAEPDETISFQLNPDTANPLPTGWSLNSDDGHAERNLTITIPENDQPPAGPPTIGWDRNNGGSTTENTGANRTIEVSEAVPAGGITLNIGIRDHVGDVQIFQAGTGTQISQVTFAEGETAARRIDFLMVNDNIAEGAETIHIELSLPEGQTLPEGWVFSNRVVTYTITANSGSQQRVGFAAANDATTTLFRHPTTATEGSTITLFVKSIAGTAAPAGGFKVNVEATEEDGANGTANANADVTLSASQLTFAEGDIFQELTVTIVDDAETEADELITLQLSAVADDGDNSNGNEALPSGWAFDSSEYTITIGKENETFVTSTSTTATEGDIVTLTAILPKPAPSDFTMTVTSADTSEITIISNPTFSMGDTQATYIVMVTDDAIAEAEEEISVQLDPTSFPSGSGFVCGEKDKDGETINTCHGRVRIQPSDNAIAFASPTSSVSRADLEALAAGTTLTHTIAIQANAADNTLPAVPSDITLHLTSNSEAVATPATLTIPAGLRTANLVLDINPAYIHAENQIARLAFTPDLSDFPAGWDITAATHAITLNAPDKHTIGFAASYLGFLKVDEEQGTQTINLTLSEPAPAGGLTINLASENTDRVTTPATIAIAAGATTATAEITIVNNQTSGDVTNLLTLSGTLPSDWEFRPHELLLHIVNDDYLIGFPTTTMTVAETSTADITVTVQLSEPAPAGGIIVAVQPSDLSLFVRRIDLRRAILNFPAGTTERSVTFKTIDNTITGDQTVTLTLEEDRPSPLPTSTTVYQTIEGKRYWAIDPDRATFTLTITDDDDDSFETVAFDTANSTSTTFEGDPSAELVITLSAAAPAGTRYDPVQESGESQADFDARKARVGNLSDLAFTVRSSSPDDIRPRNGFIIVPEGVTQVRVPLLVLRDDVTETAAEPITFSLIASSGSTVTYDNNGNVVTNTPWWPDDWRLSRATHTITIQADDHPVVYFDEQFTAVQERAGTIPLRVNLAAPAPAGGFTLAVSAVQHHTGNINDTGGFLATLIPSTALTTHRFSTGATCPGGAGTTCPTDDISVPQTVTIDAGDTFIDIPVTINNDYFTEGYEVMEVTIAEHNNSLPSGWELGATGHKIAIFRSDDRQGYVRGWQAITAHEFDEDNATAITRTILLQTNAPKGGIPLKITASQADDLTITPASFTIPEGSKTFDISIAVVNDSTAEPQETITLTIEPGDAGLPSGWGFLPANTRISAGDNTLGFDHDFTIADDND